MLAGQHRAAMGHQGRPGQPGAARGRQSHPGAARGSTNLGKAIGPQGGVASIFPKSIYFWIDGAAKKIQKTQIFWSVRQKKENPFATSTMCGNPE